MRVSAFWISLLLPAAALPVFSAVYYVDQTGGDDDLDGRAANRAWKTASRVNRANFQPGDAVVFKRGEVWNEQLDISSSGAPENPITYGAYGDGAKPVIDGSRNYVASGQGLVNIAGRSHVVVAGLEVRNSPRSGVHIYEGEGIRLRDVISQKNRQHGILVFDSVDIVVEDCELAGNSLDVESSFAGIRIDGGKELSGFTIRNCRIHDNIGGNDWNSANGIYLGHTDRNIPMLRAILITGNDIYRNGNRKQNQAGRGISGSFHGDVTITGNQVRENASAGIYIGDYGLRVEITIDRNYFHNNSLRQFGGTTELEARASRNTVLVDDSEITAMGVEVGGKGSWMLSQNVFNYTTESSDIWRGFIRINDLIQDRNLKSDNNLFYSAGPRRFKRSDGASLSFFQWQSAGYDRNSINAR